MTRRFAQPTTAAFRRWEQPLAEGLRTMRARGEWADGRTRTGWQPPIIAALQGGMLLARINGDLTTLRDTLNAAVDNIRRRTVPPSDRGSCRTTPADSRHCIGLHSQQQTVFPTVQ
ncbi:hypothetical protein IWGMT90018_19050 [Mycobacterium kiyosense]|nr:hypothetical protein IWGMT90018_19050 [Mycobacterium kiyosense]